MDVRNVKRGEIVAAVGGLLLVIAVFLPAYSPNQDNPFAKVAGGASDASIWEAQKIIRIALLLAAIAPIILLYIILRDNQLSWPRGELTAVIGLVAVTLIFYTGVIERPGEPAGQVGLSFGWFIAFLGALAIAGGGAERAAMSERRRKPPGVL
jgi:archaellum biogenesis protein FlaJ (TadC family)